MPVYSYIALDPSASDHGVRPYRAGRRWFARHRADRDQTVSGTVHGTLIADTPRQARDDLRDRGLTVQRVQLRAQASPNGRGWRWWPRRQHAAAVDSFIRELSTLLGVGLPLLEALDTLLRQLRGRRRAGFRTCVLSLRDRVSAGASLAEAMREQPGLFDAMCISLVAVGEDSGRLDEALAQLADYRQRAAQFRGKLVSALIYPVIVLITGVGVSVFLMTVVTPSLLETLAESGRPLPVATRVVKTISDALVYGWWLWLGLLSLLAAAGGLVLSTARGRLWRDRLILATPFLGDLARKQAVVRLAVTVATLMRSGVVFLRALEVAEQAARNQIVRRALGRARQAVQSGREIGPALEATGALPATAVQVFDVGQQSGRLESMLDRLAQDYDHQVAVAATRFTALLEPALIVLLALMVGFIAFATILPILEAGNVL